MNAPLTPDASAGTTADDAAVQANRMLERLREQTKAAHNLWDTWNRGRATMDQLTRALDECGTQSAMLAARARALLDGRFAPSMDDVIALAPGVLQHRMALHFSARAEGKTIHDIIADMCAKV